MKQYCTYFLYIFIVESCMKFGMFELSKSKVIVFFAFLSFKHLYYMY